MSEIKIKQVKILTVKKKRGETREGVELSYKKTVDQGHSVITEECDAPPHPDLKKALSALRVHLGILSDYLPDGEKPSKEDLEKFKVTGVSIGGKEDAEGFIITGTRLGKHGSVTINTPYKRFEQSEENAYSGLSDCVKKIELVESESMAYLDGSKRGEDPQGELFPVEKVNKIQIAEPILNGTHANPEAMERVKEIGAGKVAAQKKSGKRVKQTPQNPSGIE